MSPGGYIYGYKLAPMRFGRRARAGMAVFVVIVALASAVAVVRWWHNRPPYAPDSLAFTASLRIVDGQDAQAALDGATAPVAQDGDQLVLGRVSWHRPAHSGSGVTFWIVVLDKRSGLKPGFFATASVNGNMVAVGSDAVLNKVAERYSWLRGAGNRHVNGVWESTGDSVAVLADAASPLTFVAMFPDAVRLRTPDPTIATAPVAVSDLLLAVVAVGSDRQVYWARRLQG